LTYIISTNSLLLHALNQRITSTDNILNLWFDYTDLTENQT